MLGQLPWNLSENAPHAAGIAIGELADIITVQLQDATRCLNESATPVRLEIA